MRECRIRKEKRNNTDLFLDKYFVFLFRPSCLLLVIDGSLRRVVKSKNVGFSLKGINLEKNFGFRTNL